MFKSFFRKFPIPVRNAGSEVKEMASTERPFLAQLQNSKAVILIELTAIHVSLKKVIFSNRYC